jgi:hypothetical protein
MRVAVARALAERAHEGQLDVSLQPLIDHVRRVAVATPRSARSVAWLHEVLEYTDVPEEDLLAAGLSDEELRALRLLVRPPGERSQTSYLGHIALIAGSAGLAGVLAREVKRVDLADRVEHPAVRPDGWAPPYEHALAILDARGGSSQPARQPVKGSLDPRLGPAG